MTRLPFFRRLQCLVCGASRWTAPESLGECPTCKPQRVAVAGSADATVYPVSVDVTP